jgi:hypothetical protein
VKALLIFYAQAYIRSDSPKDKKKTTANGVKADINENNIGTLKQDKED